MTLTTDTSLPSQNETNELLTKLSSKNPQLASHLTSILAYLLKTRPKNPLEQFEVISAHIKNGTLPTSNIVANESTPTESASSVIPITQQHIITACEEMQYLLGKKRPKPQKEHAQDEDEEEVDEEEEEEAPELPSNLPNLLKQFSYLRQCGISLSDDEIYQLEAGMVAIINREENSSSTESINFWGKIHTLTNDYYLIEMKKSEYDEEEMSKLMQKSMSNTALNAQPRTNINLSEDGDESVEDDHHEALGVGANEYVYYTTTSIHDPTSWKLLPYVTPLHIRLSRTTRRYLTGNLEAPVYGFPRFLGKEMHLLRALIARISHGTKVAPVGAYIRDETEDVVIPNESFAGVKSAELRSAERWQHIRLNLLREGRTEPWVDEEAEEEEDEENKASKEKEPIIPLLRSCAKDVYSSTTFAPYNVSSSSLLDTGFIVPVVEKDETSSTDEEEAELPKETSHVLTVIRSNVWPGAITVARSSYYSSIYIGWGLKSPATNDRFIPVGPTNIQSEYSSSDLIEEIDLQPDENQRKAEEEYQLEQQKEKERQLEEADEEEDEQDLELDLEDEIEPQEGSDE